MKSHAFLGALIVLAATGCGGGGSSSSAPAGNAYASRAARADTRFVIAIPPKRAASAARRPRYVSASTQSMSIAVNGNAPIVVNVTPASPSCGPVSGVLTCTVIIPMPVGNDTFIVSLYDAQNGTGNALSTSRIKQAIVADQQNTVNLTLDGIVATLEFNPATIHFPAGTPATIDAQLLAKDAQGNIIVGPGAYTDSADDGRLDIGLGIVETGSVAKTLTLPPPVSSPASPAFAIPYDGKGLTSATASTTGPHPPAAATLTLVADPTVVHLFRWSTPTNGFGIAATPDGNVWFTQDAAGAHDQLARMTPAGVLTEFPITANTRPNAIAVGPDGNLWFTETNATSVGRMKLDGTFTEFAIGTPQERIAAGPDGNLWITFPAPVNDVVRLSPSGNSFTAFPIPTLDARPKGITTGPDHNVWLCEQAGNKIARVTPTGTFTEFAVPTAGAQPYGITAGPDGNLWFTEYAAKKIGKITPAGAITEYPIPNASAPTEITAGADGNVWFVDGNTGMLGRITPQGTITEIDQTGAQFVVFATDGNLYYIGGRAIGVLVY